jgi:hypothetical protein
MFRSYAYDVKTFTRGVGDSTTKAFLVHVDVFDLFHYALGESSLNRAVHDPLRRVPSDPSSPTAALMLPQAIKTSMTRASNMSANRECLLAQGTAVVLTPHCLQFGRVIGNRARLVPLRANDRSGPVRHTNIHPLLLEEKSDIRHRPGIAQT